MSEYVLLMDDDPASHLICERLIADLFGPGVTLEYCRDDRCLEQFLGSRRYAVVILDQRLANGITGLDLVPIIRNASPGTRILLNSAYGDEELAAMAIDAGVDAYVMGRKQDDEELMRLLARELESFGKIDVLRTELNGTANTELQAKCAEVSRDLRVKMDGIRGNRRPSAGCVDPS